MALHTLYLTLSVILGLVSASPTTRGHSFDWPRIKHLIAFGDSYTYVQGTRGHQNYSFIGDLQNLAFSADDLLSDRIVQNQTATAEGGPNWIEQLTRCGLQVGLTDPQTCSKQLWDFAFAGADISEKFTALHHNFSVPFVMQTQQFSVYAQPALSNIVDPSRALVASWIGINDISDTSHWTNISSFPDFYNVLIEQEFNAIAENILPHGYKNLIFMNQPPLDRTPGNVARTAGPRPNKTMIDEWDASLISHAKHFAQQNCGTRVMVFDVNTFLNRVMDNASSFGFQNITGYCASYDQPYINQDPAQYNCLPLAEYFWFNDGHLTSHVHKILADEMEKFFCSNSEYGYTYTC